MWRLLAALGVAALAAMVAALADSKGLVTAIWAGVGGLGTAFAPALWERWKSRRAALAMAENMAELVPEGLGALLHPSRAVVPFLGRDRELKDLLDWCADPEAERLRLLVGPGGVGKSRLAVELAERLGDSWGYIEVGDDDEATALSTWREISGSKVLLVVDYAETRANLPAMLQEVAADTGRRVRVLLLARTAGEWWQQLGAQGARVRQMVTAAGAGIALADKISASASDITIVAEAARHFAKALNVPMPKRMAIELSDSPQRTLDLHAAALVLVLRSIAHTQPDASTLRVQDVLNELLGHERRYWVQSAHVRGLSSGPYGLSVVTIEQTVAVGTLLGARSRAEAADVVGRVPDGAATMTVADWLRELYPPGQNTDQEWLGRMGPDRLAELHVTTQLARSPELLMSCLDNITPIQVRQALVTLGRAAQELEEAAKILQGLIPDIAAGRGPIAASRDTLIALYEILPYPTDALAQGRALIALRILGDTPDDAPSRERGRWLVAASLHLGDIGKPAEALALAEQAVDIYRSLAASKLHLDGQSLAIALSNISIWLWEVGRSAEALPAAQEAVTIHRGLAKRYPGTHNADLARSLINLGVRLSTLGESSEALAVTEEAVSIYRLLYGQNREQHAGGLARALSNLGVRLATVNRSGEALTATEEAIEIYRRITDQHPDRYRADFASALTNASIWLIDLGCLDDAYRLVCEALTIRLQLEDDYPNRYDSGLAITLANHGICLFHLGYAEKALVSERKTLEIRRQLASRYSDRYEIELGRSLTNIGNSLAALGYAAEALDAAEEAILIHRRSVAAGFDHHRADLAISLTNLSARFLESKRPIDALPAAQEAASIFRDLDNPNARHYVGALSNIGNAFFMLELYNDALVATREAVSICRRLAAENPLRCEPELAGNLSNLGIILSEVGLLDEALSAEEEALDIRRGLVERYPERYRSELGASLSNITIHFGKLEQLDKAILAIREAVGIYRTLFERHAALFREALIDALNNLGSVCEAMDEVVEAAQAREEVERLRRGGD
ncbi:ATP-binding protein [Nonomuraea sp. NN258]|uniref:tetratricopeptide repeat protein n=1 Tax=Nonomuraea antri TaxID=2730852 RepID=UPI0015687E0C|nr:tetratricopeptide repeat protein [Nonomuraea antri]NRQ39493.1 ATP-binding protein [Nonomuraea antri]